MAWTIPDDLKDEPLSVNAYDHESPRRHPWRPFDEHGHEKISQRWGDLTWRNATITILVLVAFFIVWVLTGEPRGDWCGGVC